MGRRVLPKIDHSVEIDKHYVELDDLAGPFDCGEFFGQARPLEIEVGIGKGLFMLNASSRTPTHSFLGIEIAKKYCRFAAYRLAKNEADNAKLIRGDALRFFSEFLPSNVAIAVHVYFPDPWWKARHRRRRVMQESFIQDVYRCLKSEGTLHFWTDVQEYYETTCQLIASTSDFSEPLLVTEREAQDDMDFQTHFERRMRLNDHPVFRVRFVKSGLPAYS